MDTKICTWPCGAMDSALDFESSGCGFESHQGRFFFFDQLGRKVVTVHEMTILHFCLYIQTHPLQVEPFGVIRKNWNDTEKISMAPAQG